MSKKDNADESGEMHGNSPSFNRRRFVKALGVAGGASVFGATSASGASTKNSTATQNRATQSEVRTALQADGVQTLLDEVANPAIERSRAQTITGSTGEQDFEAITVPTSLGEVLFAESSDGRAETYLFLGGALTERTETISPRVKKRLPEKYRTLPPEAEAMITVEKHNIPQLVRHATPNEQRYLSRLTNVPTEEMIAVVDSVQNQFMVADRQSDTAPQKVNVGAGDAAFREVTRREFADAAVEESSVTTQGLTCWQACSLCISGTPMCLDCVFVCAGSLVTWPMIIACAICVVVDCGGTTHGCHRCMSCR